MVSSRSYAAADVEDEIPHASVLDLLVRCGLMAASWVSQASDRLAAVGEKVGIILLFGTDDFDLTNRTTNDSGGYQITSKGFQFLLEDRSVQIWQILMFYVQLRKVSKIFNAEQRR